MENHFYSSGGFRAGFGEFSKFEEQFVERVNFLIRFDSKENNYEFNCNEANGCRNSDACWSLEQLPKFSS